MVKAAYEEEFGDKALVLTDYLPRQKYYDLLSSAGYAIFFHERQQASCNVEELLRHGVKIFFSETSLNYRHYSETGYHVYTVQNDLSINNIKPLQDCEKWDNIKKWHSTNNKEYRLNILNKLYDIIENE